jgi:hypothetical protein
MPFGEKARHFQMTARRSDLETWHFCRGPRQRLAQSQKLPLLYSTVSRPFVRPASGKIAVKVINHYGDEVLKVFGV